MAVPTDVKIIHEDFENNRIGINTRTPLSGLHLVELSDSVAGLTIQRVSATANKESYVNMINSDGNTWKISATGTETFTLTNPNADVFIFSNAGALTVPGALLQTGALSGAAAANALLMGVGTDATPALNATANKHFIEFRVKQNATSGDNRGIYLRTEFANTGGGDGIRNNTVLSGTVGTINSFHTGLEFATSSTISGLANAGRSTLMFANEAGPGGTVTAHMVELWAGGASTDVSGHTTSFIRVVAGGNATGMTNIEENALMFDLAGVTAGSGKFIDTDITTHTAYGGLRVSIPGVGTRYLALVTD